MISEKGLEMAPEDIENRRLIIPIIDGHVKIEQYRVSKFLKEGYTF